MVYPYGFDISTQKEGISHCISSFYVANITKILKKNKLALNVLELQIDCYFQPLV